MLCLTTTVTSCSQDDELEYCEQESLLKTKAVKVKTNGGGEGRANTSRTSGAINKTPKTSENKIGHYIYMEDKFSFSHLKKEVDYLTKEEKWTSFTVYETFYYTFYFTTDKSLENIIDKPVCIKRTDNQTSTAPFNTCLIGSIVTPTITFEYSKGCVSRVSMKANYDKIQNSNTDKLKYQYDSEEHLADWPHMVAYNHQ